MGLEAETGGLTAEPDLSGVDSSFDSMGLTAGLTSLQRKK